MSSRKVMIVLSTVGLIKTMLLYKMGQYFLKSYECSSGNEIAAWNLSSYATRANLKEATGVDTSNEAAKSDLASLKADVNKLGTDNLKIVSVDLSKLNNVVDNDVL